MRKLLILLGIIICASSCGNREVNINDYNGMYYIYFAESTFETYHRSWTDKESYLDDESMPEPMYLDFEDDPMPLYFDFENKVFVMWGEAYPISDVKFDVSYEKVNEDAEFEEYICTATFHISGDDAMYEFVDMGSEGISLLVTDKYTDEEYYTVWIYHACSTYQEAMDHYALFS